MATIQNVAIVVYEGYERLDVEGPMGVLGWAGQVTGDPVHIRLLSVGGRPVRDHLLKRTTEVDGATDDGRKYDLVIVPGGDYRMFGQTPDLADEVGRIGDSAGILASVCTGALLVAASKLADGKWLTTHWDLLKKLGDDYPKVKVAAGHRFYRDGALWSSAGISAGIDMALRLVMATWDDTIAAKVQGMLEYFPEPPFTRDEVIAARKRP